MGVSLINILVVGEDPSSISIIKDALFTLGFKKVNTILNMEKAKSDLVINVYDLIIMDINLNENNNMEFVYDLRHDFENKNFKTPVIIITGTPVKRDDVIKARDTGVTEFMVKPFSVSLLQDIMDSIVYNPREFIISENYIGPDRRRKEQGPPEGEERRSDD